MASHKLKGDAPDDAVDTLSKQLVVPLLEKMLAHGAILEYEVDALAVHTEASGNFWISWVAANPEGIDKVNAAIRETLKSSPPSPTRPSMTDSKGHRDELLRGRYTFK